jgi:hypothetical protein
MNKGKILKVRPGHDANCSSHAYILHVMVSYGAYVWFLLVMAAAQFPLLIMRLAGKPWAAKPWIVGLMIGVWVIPHVAAMPILWNWASGTGMMDYGTAVCIYVLELAMLVSLGVGCVVIAGLPRALRGKSLPPEVQQAARSCPGCGADVAASDSNCPSCGFDLASAHEQAGESAE